MSEPGRRRGRNRSYDPFDEPIRSSSVRPRLPLWWAGWRPLATTTIAGFAGLALGSLVATWRLRWLDTVGGGGVSASVATPSTFASSVLVAYAPGFVVVALCLAVGGGVWLLGCREVNRRYESVVASFFAGVSTSFTDARAYTLRLGVGGGSPPLVEPEKHYVGTHLLLGDEAAFYEGSLDLVRRRLQLGDRVDTLEYADIDSARYTAPWLELETADGEVRRYECDRSRTPTAALSDLRDRLD